MKLIVKLGLMALLAGPAIGPAKAGTLPRIPVSATMETGRSAVLPVSELRGGRMRLTLGIGAAHDFGRDRYRYRSYRHWPHLRSRYDDPFWDRPFRYRHWSRHRFDRYDPWFESGTHFWRRHHRRVPHSLRLEWQEELRPRSLRVYPSLQTQSAHRTWCFQKYRSYRASDNSFQPNRGGRKRCQSPYGR
ncbi:BA14K family protein [Nitratireductor pacificus]|uniref:Lectin-like protein BA14k n=1 Tax=Nitratireductor pacificus pht-3B TaxID=391937 RepID=K2N9P9_9HYPH|nr:BA14K family protein [Nitratireductor pacificus]EKF20863.1 BA14K family protein [Nitratireductor pacificus pht-3B]